MIKFGSTDGPFGTLEKRYINTLTQTLKATSNTLQGKIRTQYFAPEQYTHHLIIR
uniref:Uncharacterized protein n=1 Tax=Arion vulgaris TaxID=1028688 RepID=A0A0B6ZID8_9EUPU